MSEMSLNSFSLPLALTDRLEKALGPLNLSLSKSSELAAAVKRQSDFYIGEPVGRTPWSERWCQAAQLGYYLPVNFLRASRVMREARRLGFFDGLRSVLDFGSGLGPVQLAFEAEVQSAARFSVVERSSEALRLSRLLGAEFDVLDKPEGARADLLTASYSLTELESPPPWLFEFENMILIEPSTRQDSRSLLKLRQILIDRGYQMWAPCTHQAGCPLLEKSPADWCHDRLHFDRPDWMLAIEKRLPFENPTLTLSYLVASRRPRPVTTQSVRTVGDLMREKGKARQLICRGPEREFFAWMARHGEPQDIPRGVLCEMPEGELKSNEWRVQGPVSHL